MIVVRPLVSVLLGSWWLAVLALFALRWADTGAVAVVALQCALPVAGASLTLLLAIAMFARRWVIAAMTALLIVPMVWLASPWWFQEQGGVVVGARINVMSVNMLYGRADLAALEDAVRERRVDALVLLEITPDAVDRLDASDIPQALPHRSGQARTDAGGTMVLTAMPHQPVADVPDLVFDQVAVEVQGSDGGPDAPWLLFGAHPAPPTLPQWRGDLAALTTWAGRADPQMPLVMAGDFNASSGHPAFRELEADLTDAHRATAAGWVRTWPSQSVVPAFVQLDHVLASGLQVIDAGTMPIPGSDHDAVWADLSP